jgi:hypothetical protein
MTTTIYALGIPTKPDFITDELSNFINDGVPTLYITMNNPNEQFDDYNFYKENNFEYTGKYTDNITAERIQSSEKRLYCSLPVDPYDFSSQTAVLALPARVGQRINQILNEIRLALPTIRIAFCTYGSPWLWNRTVLATLKNNQCAFTWNVIDVRSFDDPNNDKFYKVGFVIYGVLPLDAYKRIPKDRSGGIFLSDNPSIPFVCENIPIDTYTDLTYAQIVDETAMTYAGQNPIVAWSGGIDSTVIVAAFIKNNIDFRVTVGKCSLKENPEMHAHLVANYKTIEIPDDNDFSNIADTSSIIVTGEPNGHLFSRLKQNYLPGVRKFNDLITSAEIVNPLDYSDELLAEVPNEYLYNNVREYFITKYQDKYKSTEQEASTLYDEYLKPKIDKFPFEVKHYYQLVFFFKLIFGYQEILTAPFIKGSKCKNPVRAFFDTQNFQRWAITNLDANFEAYSTNYKTEKYVCKEYIYDVFKMPGQLELHKYPSEL